METTALTFGNPAWLWALAVLPLFAGLAWWAHVRGQRLLSRLVAERLRLQLAGALSPGRRLFRALLFLLALALVIIALAQPRTGYRQIEIRSEGRDVILAIDVSRSMMATDVPPSRLERARLFSRDLIEFLRGDRVGIVAFAGSAFLQAPLTLDQSAIHSTLDELNPDLIPKGGTNIAAAIETSLEAFDSAEGVERAVVIVTDGEELDADGIAAARSAAAEGVTIFTVGIGSNEGSLIPVVDEYGRRDFVRGADGQPVLSKLDADRLEEIANVTNGFYVALSPEAARTVFEAGIEPMERTETGTGSMRQPIERYQLPLLTGIGLLFFWLLVGERRRRIPRTVTVGGAGLLLAGVFLLASQPAQAFSANGFSAYEQGDFAGAMDAFGARARTSHEPAKNAFNAGVAAHRAGQHPKAVEWFTEALLQGDEELQAKVHYNLGNTLVRLGEAAEGKDNKIKQWESAIEKYEAVPEDNPLHPLAQENIEIVRKLIEELNQEDQQDQQQDQQDQQQDQQDQQQDQQDQQQDQQDQQQDQQDQQQDQQDQQQDQQDQQQDQQDQRQDQQDQQQDQQDQQQDQQDQQQDQQDQQQGQQDQQQGQQDQQPQPQPQEPEERKEGELESAEGEQETPQQMPEEFEERDGEMSPQQARALLDSLRDEEERVRMIERARQRDVLRDW